MNLVDFSTLLVLSFIGVAYMLNCHGLILVFWSFHARSWFIRQKTKKTTKGPPHSFAWPCPSSKGSKVQKDHLPNTYTNGKH